MPCICYTQSANQDNPRIVLHKPQIWTLCNNPGLASQPSDCTQQSGWSMDEPPILKLSTVHAIPCLKIRLLESHNPQVVDAQSVYIQEKAECIRFRIIINTFLYAHNYVYLALASWQYSALHVLLRYKCCFSPLLKCLTLCHGLFSEQCTPEVVCGIKLRVAYTCTKEVAGGWRLGRSGDWLCKHWIQALCRKTFGLSLSVLCT